MKTKTLSAIGWIPPKTGFLPATLLVIANCLLSIANSFSQTPGEWTWMHGDNFPNSLGSFGVQGVASSTNKPPALYEPCEWKDNNGNFWLFGGATSVGINFFSALWKYDPNLSSPTYNQWAWIKGPSTPNQTGVYGTQGVPSPSNYPGSRGYGVTSWVDASGNLWLFGGYRYDVVAQGKLNDLWKYNISTNEWTWMKGPNAISNPGSYGIQGVPSPTNLPPSRWETSCSWTDNVGNLWLYGGSGGGVSLGDLWKYDIATNQWTWMHGANTVNPPAVYGTQGIAAPNNTPGGRMVYCSWVDLSGNLWLFGGSDIGGSPMNNDLWKYDIAANQWIWMKGSNTTNDPGNYGAKCISTTNNIPPARHENRGRVRDNCGNFWNFGGAGLNDLWHYSVSTNQWTWVSGDNVPNQVAVYGTQGISATTNKPGARKGNVAWTDNNGYIWIFGGSHGMNDYNDLFRYVPDPACVPSAAVTVSSNTTICIGQSATLAASGGISYSWSPGGQSTSSVVVSPTTSTTYTVTGGGVCGSVSASVTVTVNNSPTAITSSFNVSCSGASDGTATVIVAGGTPSYAYLWSNGATTSQVSNLTSQIYTVTVTDARGCSNTQVVTIEPPVNSGELYLPNAFSPNNDGENDEFCLQGGIEPCIKELEIIIYDRWGEKVYESADKNFCWDGIYQSKLMNSAVFVYYMEATLISEETITKKGNISLMR